MLVLGDEKMLAVQQLADGHYRVYFGLVAPEYFYHQETESIGDLNDKAAAIRTLLASSEEFFANWAPEVKGFIEHAEGPFRSWPLYFIPPDTISWERSVASGITLMGDAAHASTPFVGEGVNCSMYDAVRLAECLVEHCGKNTTLAGVEGALLEAALTEYENDMFGRGQDLIRRSAESGGRLFSENAGPLLLQLFNGVDDNASGN
jgi:2-polyprenyl-6-methoxyphenol hydroxylase-like FAD-dependent oxidoreductase